MADQRFDRDDVERIVTPAPSDHLPLSPALTVIVVVFLVAAAGVLWLAEQKDAARDHYNDTRAIRRAVEQPCPR